MKVSVLGRGAALFLSAFLLATAAEARDVYKAVLDPGVPRHRAILDTLEHLQKTPADAGLKNDLACLIAQEGFWRDALRELSEAAKLDKKDSRPLFNAGLVETMRGEWRSARGYFHAATKRAPGNWPAWWMKGFCEERLGNIGAAVEAYKVSLRVDTSLFDVAVNPYAVWTGLKMRVLLETYDKRRVRASLPGAEQLSQPERIASFFQKARRSPEAAAAPAPEPLPEGAQVGGPAITAIPAVSTASPSRGPGVPKWNPSPPLLKEEGRRRRAEASAAPVPTPLAQPPAATSPPQTTPPTDVAPDAGFVGGPGMFGVPAGGSPGGQTGTVSPTPTTPPK